jgi:hypothetical protein
VENASHYEEKLSLSVSSLYFVWKQEKISYINASEFQTILTAALHTIH